MFAVRRIALRGLKLLEESHGISRT